MKPNGENLGRTVLIAVIAGVLFAGFLALTPRLTAGSQPEEVGPAAVPATAPADPVQEAPGLDGFDTSEDVVEETHEPEPAPADCPPCECECANDEWEEDEEWAGEERDDDCWSDDTCNDSNGDHETVFDDTLALAVEVFGEADGKESVILRDFDAARFQIRLDNTSDEELWGVFAYLEGYGPISCMESHLDPGEHTACTVTDTVYSGTHTGEVWANAWTTQHQVGVLHTFRYFVVD